MKELRILSPTGILGCGFPAESLAEGMAKNPMPANNKKLPLWRKIFYTLSTAGFVIIETLILTFAALFYLAVTGGEGGKAGESVEGLIQLISNENIFSIITAIGMVFLFGRVIDSLADPVVATLSDRSRLKFGRRRFFLMISGFPMVLSCALIFFPPVSSGISGYNTLHLALWLGLFYIFFTAYVCPYLALIPELMATDAEKINTTTLQAVFGLIGAASVMIGSWKLISFFIHNHIFEGLNATQRSYQVGILIFSAIGLIFLYLAVIAVDEKRYVTSAPSNLKLLPSVKMTLKNTPFIYYVIGNITFCFAFNIVRSITAFYIMVLMQGSESDVADIMMVIFGAAAICFIPVNYLTRKIGKRKMMIIGNIHFGIVISLIFFLGKPPFDNTLIVYVLFALSGFPIAIQAIVPNAMVSNIADLDGLETGHQREGMFFGVQGLLQKVNIGLSVVLFGALFSVFGKDIGNDLGIRLTGPLSGIICLIGVWFFYMYPEKEVEDKLAKLKSSA